MPSRAGAEQPAQLVSELDARSRESLRALSASLGLGDRCVCDDPSAVRVLDLTGDGAVLLDASRRVVLLSPKAAALLGRTRLGAGRSCEEAYGCQTCGGACPSREHGHGRRIVHIGASLLRSPLVKECAVLRAEDGRVVGYLESLHQAWRLKAAFPEDPLAGSPRACATAGALDEIVGETSRVRELRARIACLAGCSATVLITGETGVGKELVARALHEAGPRRDRPFQAISCAALTEGLLESEVFGHERGAFTGAVRRKAGRFELAADGTLLLDEIGCLGLPVQAKLLRALESREFERVGGSRTLRLDARVVAATNADLAAAVAAGRFRADLYYRLNVVPLTVPALRERRADIPRIARRLLERMDPPGDLVIADDALALLERHEWPGNVRELWNVLQHAAALRSGNVIDAASLPVALRAEACAEASDPAGPERARVERALVEAGFNRARAAERLGMSRTTLWRRMRLLRMT